MTKHTPGPWRVDYMTVLAGTKNLVAECASMAVGESESKANARLIAAAPEMLEALKTILAHPRTNDKSVVFMPDEVAKARAAIAKAEGNP